MNSIKQNALTLISPVEKDSAKKLGDLLVARKIEFRDALGKLGTIHYARWVIVPGETLDGEVIPDQLVFSSNFDGDPDVHFQDLVNSLGSILDEIYENTVGYQPANKLAFLKQSQIPEAAFYQGSPRRTVRVIAQEKKLHYELADLVYNGNWTGMSAKQIHAQLRDTILSKPEYSWAKDKLKVPGINWFGLILAGIVILALVPIIILWAIYIQVFFERKDKPLNKTPNQLDDKHIHTMELDEDFHFQNQFSQIINMKKGRSRAITVNGLYLFTRVLVKVLFVKGKLMGIPTIHFARWVQLDNKKRMLFFSNFDGSWTQYLGDFIDKSGWGLTGIFSNTDRFPRAYFLFFGGAYNERQFLAWARNTQIQTQIWYAADLTQSIKNINNNTAIRNLLNQDLSEKKATSFLERI